MIEKILEFFDFIFYPFFLLLYTLLKNPTITIIVNTLILCVLMDLLSDKVKKVFFKKNLEMIENWEKKLRELEETYVIAVLNKESKDVLKGLIQMMNDISAKIFFARIAVNSVFLALMAPYALWAHAKFSYKLVDYHVLTLIFFTIVGYILFLFIFGNIVIFFRRKKAIEEYKKSLEELLAKGEK